MDRAHTRTREPSPRQRVEIGEPLAGALRGEARGGARISAAMRFEHVGADFVDSWADRGAHPDKNVRGIGKHGRERAFQHAGGKSSPARVCGSHHASFAVGE